MVGIIKKFYCRITRSCIYWKDDVRENINLTIKADSLEEAKVKLHKEAFNLEFSSASKLVQDILISVDGEWIPA